MRTAAEIDAAKVLNTTDLGAITSEVRQFPPGYVTGGRLKLNTNLQIEVAPIAINIAGKDVRIAETVIIGNEHWVIDGVETPRVPGSWYYLYLSTAAQFAVSPVEPAYNNLYFAYYHPEIQDLRAIGKLYFGNDGTILYVQTSLETASAQVLVASSTYTGEDANYYCSGTMDEKIIQAAIDFLDENFGRGQITIDGGIIYTQNAIQGCSNLTLNISKGSKILRTEPYVAGGITVFSIILFQEKINFDVCGGGEIAGYSATLAGVAINTYNSSSFQIHDLYIHDCNSGIYINTDNGNEKYSLVYNNQINNVYYGIITEQSSYVIIDNNHIINSYEAIQIWGTSTNQTRNIKLNNNIIKDVYDSNLANRGIAFYATGASIYDVEIHNNTIVNIYGNYEGGNSRGIDIATTDIYNTIVFDNFCKNNGQLIDRGTCNSSSTSPMIFGEAAPTASNCTWGFTATGPYEGVGCYRFTKSVAAGTMARLHLVDNVGAADVHGLIPGTQYEWGGWLKVAASASCGFQGFRLYQATTGGGAASAVAFTTATTGWQEVWVTATVYVGATTAYIGLVASASLATMSFDVDNLRLFPPGTTNVHNQNYYNGGTNTYDGL